MGLSEPLTRRKRRTRLTPERERELYGRTLDLVRDVGYETMTLDAVAAESKCSKATLYRQWGSKPRLVSEALRELRPFSLEDLDTGSLRGDLHAFAERVGEARKDIDLVRGISLAIRKDADLADAVHEALVQPELDLFEAMLSRAADRGEIDRAAAACDFLPHMFVGAVFSRPLLERQAADTTYLQRYVDTVVLPLLLNA
ncbi:MULTISPECIES: TetR/AcrR family transcriptional regulator [unclassified Streptomyces]|uniref:TetR/AcrR family transcriptional regulator n=1 Tax=unclassified Streptomyces TaxID=2593676 RepID=UPI00278C6B69|nr:MULTISPECIES: TetR/AcrR family transcriptional regulator [unclassified Streptomyces]